MFRQWLFNSVEILVVHKDRRTHNISKTANRMTKISSLMREPTQPSWITFFFLFFFWFSFLFSFLERQPQQNNQSLRKWFLNGIAGEDLETGVPFQAKTVGRRCYGVSLISVTSNTIICALLSNFQIVYTHRKASVADEL